MKVFFHLQKCSSAASVYVSLFFSYFSILKYWLIEKSTDGKKVRILHFSPQHYARMQIYCVFPMNYSYWTNWMKKSWNISKYIYIFLIWHVIEITIWCFDIRCFQISQQYRLYYIFLFLFCSTCNRQKLKLNSNTKFMRTALMKLRPI